MEAIVVPESKTDFFEWLRQNQDDGEVERAEAVDEKRRDKK